MVKDTGIEWADSTFNPIMGCAKVSEACRNCYAMDHVNRYGGDFLGKRVMTSDSYWKQPLKWNKEAEKSGKMQRVFCASLSDVFECYDGPIYNHKGEQLYSAWHHAQPEWVASDKPCEGEPLTLNDVRRRLFQVIDETPNLVWMILTKRPENVLRMWPKVGFPDSGVPGTLGRRLYLGNVWIGTTVENQEQANKRIPELLKCRDLSPVLFLSCEPLLGPVDLYQVEVPEQHDMLRRSWDVEGSKFNCLGSDDDRFHQSNSHIDWVICGGESGKNARPMSFRWAWSLKQQCESSGVPFFFKQWGEWQSGVKTPMDIEQGAASFKDGCYHDFGDEYMALKVGKKSSGDDLLWGQEYKSFPGDNLSVFNIP